MFCPECKDEFRPGFTHCADCGVDLVEKLPDENDVPEPEAPLGEMKEVWGGRDQETCVFLCLALKQSGIPYRVTQNNQSVFSSILGDFRILVPAEFYDKAKKIIEGDDSDDSDDPDSTAAELPAQDDKPPTDNDDAHADWKDEAPDDASVEVASGLDRAAADMIVLGLRENDVESRVETLPDGSRQIFVEPQDESRAREVIREIETESPPE